MEWQELHDIATHIMAEKIGSDQVLDDLLDFIPLQELEKYLREIDMTEDLNIFNSKGKKVTMSFIVNNTIADEALKQMRQGEMANAANILNENCEESDYYIEDLD